MLLKKAPTTQSKAHSQRLKMFVNKDIIKDTTPEAVFKNHKELHDFILTYKNLETRKGYLQTVIDSLKRLKKPTEEQLKLIQKYATEAYELAKLNKEAYKDNKNTVLARVELSGVDYDKLCSVMDELTTKMEDGEITSKEHLLLVILNMNLRQAPLRSEISNMRYLDLSNPEDKKIKLDKNENYLVKNEIGQYHYILHKYKTKGMYGDKTIKIKNTILKDFLNKSFKLYPRKFLVGTGDKPIKYTGYLTLLRWAFGVGIGADMIRSVYITEFMRHNPSIKAREELAASMLHSTASQELFYNKLPDDHVNRLPVPRQDIRSYKRRPKKQLSSDEDSEEE